MHKLVTYDQPEDEASCKFKLVDAIRVCRGIDAVIVRLEVLF